MVMMMNQKDEDNDLDNGDGSGRQPSSFSEDVVDGAELLLNLSSVNNIYTTSMATSSTGGSHPPPSSSSRSSSSSSFQPYDNLNSSRISSTYLNDVAQVSGKANDEEDYGPIRECRLQLTSLTLSDDDRDHQLSRSSSDSYHNYDRSQHSYSASTFLRPHQQPAPLYQDLTFTARTGWRYQPPQHSLDRLGLQRRWNDYHRSTNSLRSQQQQNSSEFINPKIELKESEEIEGSGNSCDGDDDKKNQANKNYKTETIHSADSATVVTESTKESTLTSTSLSTTTTATSLSLKTDVLARPKEETSIEASDNRLTPKAVLHKYYTQKNKDPKYKNSKNKIRITSEANFLTFDDGTTGQTRYTCIFLCPITEEAFLAGPLRWGPGGPSHHDYTTERIEMAGYVVADKSDNAVVDTAGTSNDSKKKSNESLTLYWYSRKATAEHAASACAWDCFMKREGKSKAFQLGEGHPYHPQDKPTFPRHPRIPSNVWKRIPGEQRMTTSKISDNGVDTDEGTESSDSLPPSKKTKATSSNNNNNISDRTRSDDGGRSKHQKSGRSRSRRRKPKSTDTRENKQTNLPSQSYPNQSNQSYGNHHQLYPRLVPSANHPLQHQQHQQHGPPPPPPLPPPPPPPPLQLSSQQTLPFQPPSTSQPTIHFQHYTSNHPTSILDHLAPGQYQQPQGQINLPREGNWYNHDFNHYRREHPQHQQQPNSRQWSCRNPSQGNDHGQNYEWHRR